MEQQYKPYIAGSFAETSQTLTIYNPHTGATVAHTWLCGAEEIEAAIRKGSEARKAMQSLPSWKKSEALRFIAERLKENRDAHALLLASESAKPLRYALAEIDRAIQTFLIASEECKRIGGEVLQLDWTPAGENREGIIKYFPIGLVAGISPFNFPLNLAVHKIAPAIATGCPIVLKPASSTPLSTLALAKIIHEAGLPEGAVSILPADRRSGNQLVEDDRIQLLSFTGSDTVGWKMKQASGKKKTVLELGGNAGVIITPSANTERLTDLCTYGAFAYSGQICIHAQRFFVHRNHYDHFVEQMTIAAGKLKTGAPEEAATELSSMIDEENARRVENWVNEALESGASLCCGGERQGAFYAPTILTQTSAAMKVNSEEVFGPVITIEPYDEFADAVTRLNETRFGLQAGVFTENIQEMNYAFEHIDAGGIILNHVPTLRFDHAPYGGVKDSGIGREGVKYAMHDMLETKILVK